MNKRIIILILACLGITIAAGSAFYVFKPKDNAKEEQKDDYQNNSEIELISEEMAKKLVLDFYNNDNVEITLNFQDKLLFEFIAFDRELKKDIGLVSINRETKQITEKKSISHIQGGETILTD